MQLHYDSAGNLLSEQGVNGKLDYEWDALANLLSLVLPQGDQLQWLYYGSGHTSAIKFNQQLVSEFTRDRLHRETGRTQGSLLQQRQYDELGRRRWQSSFRNGKISKPEEGLLWRVFRYTGRGELEGVSDALRGEIHYGYDAEGRLQQHTEPRQSLRSRHLHYDLADNLLGEDPLSSGGARQQPAAIVSNRLTTWQQLFYRYDAWGNLVSRRHGQHEQHYTYDADNRLISARGRGPEGEFTAHYHYDALGRRIRKTVDYRNRGTETTRFLWQGYRLLQEQRDNATRRTWSYDPASPWAPLAAIEQAGNAPQADIYWLHTDLNSAPLEVTDEDGNLRWSGQYDTFGKLRGQTPGSAGLRTGAAYAQPLRFAGQYQDNESGLHYNLFRYYEPEVGRFTTQDPIGLAGGINLYQYAPNPQGWVDPWGLTPDRFPSWMETTRGYQRQHLIPYSLKEHPFFSRSGMDINGASNMMRLPVAPGIDPNPNLGLHRGWTAEHADYNREIRAELDALEQKAVKNNWDYRRAQREVLNLQHERRAGFKTGRYTCA